MSVLIEPTTNPRSTNEFDDTPSLVSSSSPAPSFASVSVSVSSYSAASIASVAPHQSSFMPPQDDSICLLSVNGAVRYLDATVFGPTVTTEMQIAEVIHPDDLQLFVHNMSAILTAQHGLQLSLRLKNFAFNDYFIYTGVVKSYRPENNKQAMIVFLRGSTSELISSFSSSEPGHGRTVHTKAPPFGASNQQHQHYNQRLYNSPPSPVSYQNVSPQQSLQSLQQQPLQQPLQSSPSIQQQQQQQQQQQAAHNQNNRHDTDPYYTGGPQQSAYEGHGLQQPQALSSNHAAAPRSWYGYQQPTSDPAGQARQHYPSQFPDRSKPSGTDPVVENVSTQSSRSVTSDFEQSYVHNSASQSQTPSSGSHALPVNPHGTGHNYYEEPTDYYEAGAQAGKHKLHARPLQQLHEREPSQHPQPSQPSQHPQYMVQPQNNQQRPAEMSYADSFLPSTGAGLSIPGYSYLEQVPPSYYIYYSQPPTSHQHMDIGPQDHQYRNLSQSVYPSDITPPAVPTLTSPVSVSLRPKLQKISSMSSKSKRRTKPPEGDHKCLECGREESPEWRKGPAGPKTLCNACGLRWAKQNKSK